MTDARFRVVDLIDEGSFEPVDQRVRNRDPLSYPSYRETLGRAASTSGSDESVTTGAARVGGYGCELAVFEFGFLGGSMGEIAGERLSQAMERAAARGVAFVVVTATGGARMQEGMRSLVQMPKVVAARLALRDARVPFLAVLAHPTTGGVLASLAALADYSIASAGATIGFAGPRLVERQTGRSLRPGSHTAESAVAAGLVDEVARKGDMRAHVTRALGVLAPDPATPTDARGGDEASRPAAGSVTPEPPQREGWDAVLAARAPDRRRAPNLALAALDDAIELRGDRAGGDDPAVRAFLGRTAVGRRVGILALDRNHPPGPRAYRKAARAVATAGRLSIPLVTLIDTPGADASEESEAAGIAWAIAQMFEALMTAPVPVISILTGEGTSGGALAFAAGDVLVAYDDTIFSVIAPELAAEILWRDPDRAPDAAALLKVSPSDLLALGIVDQVVPGPPSGDSISHLLAYHLDRSQGFGEATRRRRWRSI